MSVQAITWAYKQSVSSSGAKFLLVTLANYADADGVCWPGVSRLADDMSANRKSILKWTHELINLYLITVEKRGGFGAGRAPNIYKLAFQQSPGNGTLPQQSPENGTLGKVPKTDLAKSQKRIGKVPKTGIDPFIEPSIEPSHNIVHARETPTQTHGTAAEPAKNKTAEPAKNKKINAQPARGTRLNIFELPDDWRHWCEFKRPDLNPDDTFEIFVDHWKSVAGVRGLKADWKATWRNWVRNQFKNKSYVARTRAEIIADKNKTGADAWLAESSALDGECEKVA